MKTLLDIISRIDEIVEDPDKPSVTIYAKADPEWTADSEAVALPAREDESIEPPPGAEGLTYFLEVFIAREVLEWLEETVRESEGRLPTTQEKCDRVIYYATYDA